MGKFVVKTGKDQQFYFSLPPGKGYFVCSGVYDSRIEAVKIKFSLLP